MTTGIFISLAKDLSSERCLLSEKPFSLTFNKHHWLKRQQVEAGQNYFFLFSKVTSFREPRLLSGSIHLLTIRTQILPFYH